MTLRRKNIRKFCRAAVSLALAAALLIASPQALITPVSGVGTLYRENRISLDDQSDLVLTTLQHISAGRQEERYIEWGPLSGLQAVVAYGDKVSGNALTMSELHRRLTAANLDVAAIINGDFFTLSTGEPVGILVTDGILRASDNYAAAIGFPAGGGAFIAKEPLKITMSAQIGGDIRDIAIDHVNHTRRESRLVLFTPDFAATTRTDTEGIHVILDVSGSLTIGGMVSGTVREVVHGKAPATLTAGRMVLSVDAKGPVNRVADLTPGVSVAIRVDCADSRFLSIPYAIGANVKLLTNGQLAEGLGTGTAPRTAFGIRGDGTCVYYTVDGRQEGYSAGLSLTDVALRLQSLGCVEAINLDGGGSTVLGAKYPGQDALNQMGRPSDGQQRRVANFIALVNTMPRTGTVDKLFVYPRDVTVLKNAKVAFKGYATDLNYHTVTPPPLSWWSTNRTVGSMDAAGVFTAANAGETLVGAENLNNYYVYGDAAVRVVDTLDSIRLTNEVTGRTLSSLAAAPGETIDLAATGFLDNLAVSGQDICFAWSVTGPVGDIDVNGRFTASDILGAVGRITVSYGNVVNSISVEVGKIPQAAETFEEKSNRLPEGGDKISFLYERDMDRVRYGRQAGRVTYDFRDMPADAPPTLTLSANIPLADRPAYLNLWVFGDNSGNTFGLKTTDTSGYETDLSVRTLDFAGYQYFQIALPANTARVSGLWVTRAETGAEQGTLYTDQWITSHQPYNDTLPPLVRIDTADTLLQPGHAAVEGFATDDNGAPLRDADVTLRVDGVVQPFNYDRSTGRLQALPALPDDQWHKLTLEAADPAGNRSRVSVEVSSALEPSIPPVRFSDVEDTHWAYLDVAFLDARGILTDFAAEDRVEFRPDRALTRADMALFIARMLRLNTDAAADVTLPFTDADAIPPEAAPAVRALYEMRVIKGKSQNGQLFFDPAAPISRAEFCTIIGRTMAQGYQKIPTTFADGDTVPAYAKDHIAVLVSLGVIGGYPNNTMRPQNNITRAEAAKVLCRLY
ncbi:MAG: S-layer homology domain-containing protein [Oscillospiraceae bacterium]|nr:S-layer homology domain-containing protein [Oscillospiraceae bacterium]